MTLSSKQKQRPRPRTVISEGAAANVDTMGAHDESKAFRSYEEFLFEAERP